MACPHWSKAFDGAGRYHVLTTNADGTQQKDSYTNGLLSDSLQLGTGGTHVAETSYLYNPNRTLNTSTDYTGTTS